MTQEELTENVSVMNYQILRIYEDISKCEISDSRKAKYFDLFMKVFKPAFDMLGELNIDNENDIFKEIDNS